LKEQLETKGSKILWVKDEKEFYSLIEELMEEQGFEVFETSPPLSRDCEYVRFN
jgi:DNA-binding response OmpR family regulator